MTITGRKTGIFHSDPQIYHGDSQQGLEIESGNADIVLDPDTGDLDRLLRQTG